MENEQTPVEWLVDVLKEKHSIDISNISEVNTAKEMEREKEELYQNWFNQLAFKAMNTEISNYDRIVGYMRGFN